MAMTATFSFGQSFDPERELTKIDELWQRMYRCENYWCRVGLGAIVLSGMVAR
jgi:hypothetical protein